MNLFEHAAQKQRVFDATGDFTSEHPVVIAPLSCEVFQEAATLSPDSERYRPIAIEDVILPALTHFRRVVSGHSGALLRGTGIAIYREEPDMRTGIVGSEHWSVSEGSGEAPTTRVMDPHIDDSFLCAALTYFGVIGQPMLHYPGSYTLNLGKLRDEGFSISVGLFKLWQSHEGYRSFTLEAVGEDSGFSPELHDLYAQQIESQGIGPVESPTDAIFVADNQLLHSEHDQSLVVGSFRGIIRQFVSAPKV